MNDGHDAHFAYVKILEQTAALRAELAAALAIAPEERARALAAEAAALPVKGGEAALTIAFVGQYNAGKSTLLRALTGRSDIRIDADVCTETVAAYDWNGVRLLDTPGIHAGYPDHDQATYAAIDRADLLVFVVTSELFDETLGAHFRDLAFARGKAREMLLVVNKTGQDPGSPEIKLREIAKVTHPLAPADLRTVLVDALAYLEAAEAEDPEERRELLQVANFGALLRAVNRFVADRGLAGRLTTPLFTLRALAEQASAYLAVDRPEERAALELLHRKRALFLGSRPRLRSLCLGLSARAARDIAGSGDEVAEAIAPGRTAADVQAAHASAQRAAAVLADRLADETRASIAVELADLERQLAALHDSVLARELRALVDREGRAHAAPGAKITLAASPAWSGEPDASAAAAWPAQAKKIGSIAERIGGLAALWSNNPFAQGAAALAVSGAEAQQLVTAATKLFGAQLPHAAVKVTRAIGNAGRVVSAVGGVLAVVAQVAEDRQQARLRDQLRRARDEVRAAYRDAAREVEDAFWGQLEAFCREFYDSELAAVDDAAADLTGRRRGRGDIAARLEAVAAGASRLISEIQIAPAIVA